METLFNVINLMLETAMCATGRGDELNHAYVIAVFVFSLVLAVSLLRWAVQLTIKLLKKRWNY